MNNNKILAAENFRCTLCGNFLNIFPLRITGNNEKLCGRCPDIGKPILHKTSEDKMEHKSFPCSNENCQETVGFEQTDHEILCTKQRYQCPVTPFGKCPHFGTRGSLKGHFQQEHADFYHCSDNVFSTNFGQDEEMTRLFHINKESDFLLTTKTDLKANKFWFCVRFLGDTLDSNILHIYSLTLSNPDKDEEISIKNERVNPSIILHITKPESAFVKIDSTLSALGEPYSKIVRCTLIITTGKKCKWNQCSEVQSIQDITGHETGCAFKEIKEKIGCFLVEKTISTENINHDKAEEPQSTPKAITIKCRWCVQTFPVERDLMMHENSCDMIPLPCEFCDNPFPIKQYADHETVCSARYKLQRYEAKRDKGMHSVTSDTSGEGLPKVCPGCATQFSFRIYEKHIEVCEHLVTKCCKFCMKKFSGTELGNHESSCSLRVQSSPASSSLSPKSIPIKERDQRQTVLNDNPCPTYDEVVDQGKHEVRKKKCEPQIVKDQCKWCPLAFSRDEIQQHEKSCIYRKAVCPHRECGVDIRFCDLEGHVEKCKHRDKTKYKCKLCNGFKQERLLLIKHLREMHKTDFIEGDTCTKTSKRGTDWQRWYMLMDGELFRCKCNFWKDGSVSCDAHHEGQDPNKAKDFALRIKVQHLKESFTRQQCLNKRSSSYNGCVDFNVEEVAHLVRENSVSYVFTLTKIN